MPRSRAATLPGRDDAKMVGVREKSPTNGTNGHERDDSQSGEIEGLSTFATPKGDSAGGLDIDDSRAFSNSRLATLDLANPSHAHLLDSSPVYQYALRR